MRRELGDALGIQRCTLGLADLALRCGDRDRARPLLAETVSLARDSGDRVALMHAFESLADLAQADGDALRGATLRGHGERLRIDVGYVPPPMITTARGRSLAATRAAVGDDAAFERAYGAGLALSTDEAIALALRCAP